MKRKNEVPDLMDCDGIKVVSILLKEYLYRQFY